MPARMFVAVRGSSGSMEGPAAVLGALLALLSTLVACTSVNLPGDGAPPLWIRAGDCTPNPEDDQRLACQRVTLVPGLLLDRAQRLTLLLPEQVSLVVEQGLNQDASTPGIVEWRGSIVGEPYSSAVFATAGEVASGRVVTSGGQVYRLGVSRTDGPYIERLDPARAPPEHHPGAPDELAVAGAPIHLADTPRREPIPVEGGTFFPVGGMYPQVGRPCDQPSDKVVCLLVVYTDDAAGSWWLSEWWLRITIKIAIGDLQLSYRNSGVTRQIQVAPVTGVAFAESGVLKTDWNALKQDQNIRSLRNQANADLVLLVTGHPNSGSWGPQFGPKHYSGQENFAPEAYAIVPRRALINAGYTFAHELGHMMGANHDPMNITYANPGPFCYSHDHVDPLPGASPTPGIQCPAWMTLMSQRNYCINCTIQPYWSSGDRSENSKKELNFNFCGRPLGNPATADNAKTLNQTYDTVAAFQ